MALGAGVALNKYVLISLAILSVTWHLIVERDGEVTMILNNIWSEMLESFSLRSAEEMYTWRKVQSQQSGNYQLGFCPKSQSRARETRDTLLRVLLS